MFFFGILFGKLNKKKYTFVATIRSPMKQKYFYTLLLVLFLAFGTYAQEPKNSSSLTIENLNFYPNPVTNGKIYITSKNTSSKEISIYDVLGKLVLQTTLNVNSKEVNVGALNSGVYIIKIKEGDATVTRKLIVK
jgi:hypothetical protein